MEYINQVIATITLIPCNNTNKLNCNENVIEMKNYLENTLFPNLQLKQISNKQLKSSTDFFEKDDNKVILVYEYLLEIQDYNDYSKVLIKVQELQNIPLKDRRFFDEIGMNINFQHHDVFYKYKRMIIFDMDSTLIKQECIDELATLCNVEDEVKKITELAMQGQLDFKSSLLNRVGLLKGANKNILEQVKAKIEFTEGAIQLCQCLKKMGFILAVVSGGFLPLANYVKDTLGLDYAFANQLKVDSNNLLTGELDGEIITAEMKQKILLELANKHNIHIKQTMAVGDGANDILMMKAAGLGVAFNAKTKVQEQAQVCLNHPNLMGVLHLMGLSTYDIKNLLNL